MKHTRNVVRAGVGIALLGCVVVFGRTHAEEAGRALRGLGSADPYAVAAGLLLTATAMLNRGALNGAAQRAVGLHARLPAVTRTAAVAFAAQKLVKPASVSGLAVFVADGRRREQPAATVAAACALAALAAVGALGTLLVLTCVLLSVAGRLTGWWVLAAVMFAGYVAVLLTVGVVCCRAGRASDRFWRGMARLPGCASACGGGGGPPPALLEAIAAARGRPRLLVRTLAHALLSKLLGMTMLLAGVSAAGVEVDSIDIVLAYATAMAASTVSLLPGGIGAVEASTAALLASSGVPIGSAVIGVAIFRLFDLWIPVLVGAAVARGVRRSTDHDEDRDIDGEAVPVALSPAFA